MAGEDIRRLILPFLNRFLHWHAVGLGTTVFSLMMLSKGATLANIGLIVALYSSIVVIAEFPSGVLSDMIGRKRVYLLSIAFSMIGYAILLVATSFRGVLAGCVFYGLSRAFSSGSIEALFIADHIRKRGKADLHRLMSAMGTGETLGLASGALIGGILPMAWDSLRPGANRYNGNLTAQIAILGLAFFLTLFVTPAESAAAPAGRRLGAHILRSLGEIGKNRILAVLMAGFFFWGLCFNAIEVYWQPRLRDILGSDAQTWVFGIVNGGYFAASLLGILAIGVVMARWRRSFLILLGLLRVMVAAFVLALSFQTTAITFSAVYMVMFFFNGMASIPESTLLNLEIPEDRRSSLLSFSSLSMQLGAVAGSIACSLLVGASGIPGIWIIAGLSFALSSMLYLHAGKAHRDRNVTPSV